MTNLEGLTMNKFESIEQMYIRLAYECKERGDMFGHGYYMQRAFEASCLGE